MEKLQNKHIIEIAIVVGGAVVLGWLINLLIKQSGKVTISLLKVLANG